MLCHSCNNQLTPVVIAGVEIDVCTSCGGVWFDAFEFKHLDEIHEGKGDMLELLLSFPRHPDPPQKRPCLRCDGWKMKRHKYRIHTDIFIDECYNCGGIWLDGGELKAVRENFRSDTERAQAAETLLMQNPEFAEMKRQRNELNHAYNNRKSFFSALFNW